MRKNPTHTALLRPTCLLISEKSGTYTIKWSYTIIWQVRVLITYLIVFGYAKVRLPIISLIGCFDHSIDNVLVALMVVFFCVCFSNFYG